VTVTIAMFLLRWLFPNDEKTLGTLRDMYNLIKGKHNERKARKSAEKKSGSGSDSGTDCK